MVVAAGEVMREFVHQEDRQERESKRQATDERGRVAIYQREVVEQFVERKRFTVSVGDGKLGSGDQARA